MAWSYQKYQQLGSGKVMGGATTLLYSYEKGDKQSADYLSDLQTSDNLERDELQFFTHLLRYAADSELDMIEESGKNARFVGQELLPYGTQGAGTELTAVVKKYIAQRPKKLVSDLGKL